MLGAKPKTSFTTVERKREIHSHFLFLPYNLTYVLSMAKSKKSLDARDAVVATCHEIIANPNGFTPRVIKQRFNELDLTATEHTIVNMFLHYNRRRNQTRRRLTEFQTFLLDTMLGLFVQLADTLILTPEGDLLNTLIDVWDTLADDDMGGGVV